MLLEAEQASAGPWGGLQARRCGARLSGYSSPLHGARCAHPCLPAIAVLHRACCLQRAQAAAVAGFHAGGAGAQRGGGDPGEGRVFVVSCKNNSCNQYAKELLGPLKWHRPSAGEHKRAPPAAPHFILRSMQPLPQALVAQPDMLGRSLAHLRRNLATWRGQLQMNPGQLSRWVHSGVLRAAFQQQCSAACALLRRPITARCCPGPLAGLPFACRQLSLPQAAARPSAPTSAPLPVPHCPANRSAAPQDAGRAPSNPAAECFQPHLHS